jgi:acetylornithine deacetylase/succinyl-diaminopimelate desuccinylase-like protein
MPHDPAELLQRLIRFDTTNPPGNEAACIGWIQDLCRQAGLETRILAKTDERPNLVARVTGRGEAPPMLLQGHVDVVTTAGQQWTHDPFGGELIDGTIWGRGALDMKGGVAMMTGAALALAQADQAPPGDVILCALSDEEALGAFGARFLVEEHADLFDGVEHALGEFGGARTEFAGVPSYPIQVAEKSVCWTRVTIRGPGGHGSLPMRGGAMARLGRLLAKLDERRLPVHLTQVPEAMVNALGDAMPEHGDELKQALLDPERTDQTLDALGEQGELLDAMLHNTVNATIVHGGDKVNVIPSEIVLELDGRLLPGQTKEDLFNELRELSGDDGLEFEAEHDPGPETADLSLFRVLGEVLERADPGTIAVPMLLPAVTDGRLFARLGIQCYGFLPMRLPPELNFTKLIHAADERVPAEEVRWGADRIREVVERYSG